MNKDVEIDVESLPGFLKPRLRLFLSADLVGSSRLKQASYALSGSSDSPSAQATPVWLDVLVDFYRSIEFNFQDYWVRFSESCPDLHLDPGPAPELWKANGDELIYIKDITEPKQVQVGIQCWLQAVTKSRLELLKRDSSVDIKATAWMAGFPIKNQEIIFDYKKISDRGNLETGERTYVDQFLLNSWYSSGDRKTGLIRDFVGPSIDTGFRLASLAAPQKFIVSLDVLLFLASLPELPDGLFGTEKLVPIDLKYDGRVPLKGVLGGSPYPVFWIDALPDDPILAAESAITGDQKHNRDQIKKFCIEFIRGHSRYLSRPFVYGCSEADFSDVHAPHGYLEALRIRNERWLQQRKKLAGENRDISGSRASGKDEINEKESVLKSFAKSAAGQRSKPSAKEPPKKRKLKKKR